MELFPSFFYLSWSFFLLSFPRQLAASRKNDKVPTTANVCFVCRSGNEGLMKSGMQGLLGIKRSPRHGAVVGLDAVTQSGISLDWPTGDPEPTGTDSNGIIKTNTPKAVFQSMSLSTFLFATTRLWALSLWPRLWLHEKGRLVSLVRHEPCAFH